MEKLLAKMAKQLDGIDEASLMMLWDKYAKIVNHFEPTKRWEEATIIFSLIQAKKWKNQLFNYHWSQQLRPNEAEPLLNNFTLEGKPNTSSSETRQKKCKVLGFRVTKNDKTL